MPIGNGQRTEKAGAKKSHPLGAAEVAGNTRNRAKQVRSVGPAMAAADPRVAHSAVRVRGSAPGRRPVAPSRRGCRVDVREQAEVV